MFKKAILFSFLMSVVAASADVYVSWGAYAGFYFTATPGSGFLSPGTSALAQLIWTPDGTVSDATYDSPNLVSGNNIWLADYEISYAVNGEWGDFAAPNYTDGGVLADGGSVYVRIFENSSPYLDDYYYVSQVYSANNINMTPPVGDPPPTPQTIEANRNYGDAIDGTFSSQVQPVPEPGTMALFALGLATLGVSRRRRKVQA